MKGQTLFHNALCTCDTHRVGVLLAEAGMPSRLITPGGSWTLCYLQVQSPPAWL